MRNSKPYSKFLFCILIAISSILLPSCNPLNAPNESNAAVGTWATSEIPLYEQRTNNGTDEIAEATVYGIQTFTFTEDGKFTICYKYTRREVTVGNEENLPEFHPEENWEKGTYTYNEETNDLFTVGTEGSFDGKTWLPLSNEDKAYWYFSIDGSTAITALLPNTVNETINSYCNGDVAAFYEAIKEFGISLTRQ